MSVLRTDTLRTLDDTFSIDVADLAIVDSLSNVDDPTKGAAEVGRALRTFKSIKTSLGANGELKTVSGQYDREQVFVQGYYDGSRNGHGHFVWDAASTDADDGGTIIQVAGVTTGRWRRVVDQDWVSFYDFGAVGDGIADDSNAIEAAINSGAQRVFAGNKTYRITRPLAIWTSGVEVDLRGATITQVTKYAHGVIIGQTAGGAYTQVENVTIRNGHLIGNDDGLTSAYGVAIVVRAPATVPYAKFDGCNYLLIEKMEFSTWAMSTAATAATNLVWRNNMSSDTFYHGSLLAGGYGALLQTCFDVWLQNNYFLSSVKSNQIVTTDRHAIYISGDPTRTLDNNNVCRGVIISGNRIDWGNVSEVTGSELAVALRSPYDCHVSDNTIIGGIGGAILVNNENGNHSSVTIANNTVRDAKGHSISIVAGSGSNRTTGLTISGNTLHPAPFADSRESSGITVTQVNGATISGNAIIPMSAVSYGILVGANCKGVNLGPNTIDLSAGVGRAVAFTGSGTDLVTVNKQTCVNTASVDFRYFTYPTNLAFAYRRTCRVSAVSGAVTVNTDSNLKTSVTVASHASGFTMTFTKDVDITRDGFTFTSQSSSIANISAIAFDTVANSITVGVYGFGGAAMPAASNNYNIQVTVP